MITARQVAQGEKVETKAKSSPGREEFGARLTDLRKAYGISQPQAANAMGMGGSSLHYYEGGIQLPGALTLVKMVVFYETTFEHLLGPLVEAVKEGRNP